MSRSTILRSLQDIRLSGTPGENLGPEGADVRPWAPSRMPFRLIHHAWDVPEGIRRGPGSGKGVYPRPVIGHAEGRARALAALRAAARAPREEATA